MLYFAEARDPFYIAFIFEQTFFQLIQRTITKDIKGPLTHLNHLTFVVFSVFSFCRATCTPCDQLTLVPPVSRSATCLANGEMVNVKVGSKIFDDKWQHMEKPTKSEYLKGF